MAIKPRNLTIPPATSGKLDELANTGFAGNASAAASAAIEAMHAIGDELTAQVCAYYAQAALVAVRGVLSDAEIAACLDVVNSWLVDPASAAWITMELADANELDGLGERHGIDVTALVAKLDARSDFERAMLTCACRRWWSTPEPRPPATVAGVLGGRRRRSVNGSAS